MPIQAFRPERFCGYGMLMIKFHPARSVAGRLKGARAGGVGGTSGAGRRPASSPRLQNGPGRQGADVMPAAFGLEDMKILDPHPLREGLPHRGLIVHDQNTGLCHDGLPRQGRKNGEPPIQQQHSCQIGYSSLTVADCPVAPHGVGVLMNAGGSIDVPGRKARPGPEATRLALLPPCRYPRPYFRFRNCSPDAG